MVNKTVVIDVNVHKQITGYQKYVKKQEGYIPQIKDIIANAINLYIKTKTIENSEVDNSEVLTEFPIPKKE
jgi:hypothetical protein